MAMDVKALYELQKVDTAIEQGKVALEKLPERSQLQSAIADLAGIRRRRAEMRAQQQAMETELAALAIAGERVCGKRQSLWVDGLEMTTFSMMLHALVPEQSLRLQEQGLGPYRLLGCGLFVPHKSAAAVGG